MTDPTEDIGCEQCKNDDWTRPYMTDEGFVVLTCDECGRARVERLSSVDENLELWTHEVYRDEKGRFTTKA